MNRGISHPAWTIAALIIAALILTPVAFLAYLAITSGGPEFFKIVQTVMPRASWVTLQLMLGVSVFTAMTGTGLAYLVTFYRFPGRQVLAWAVVLPLALPPYIAAYGFVEFLDFAGPVQKLLRWILGNTILSDSIRITSKQYWFPEFRSLPGAIFILSSILYPYVYLTVRATFAMQGAHVAEVARTLGAKAWTVAFKVIIPLAGPAVILGVILCLMETLNDIGAVRFLGVFTLTFQIENVWINRGSLGGAAAVALVLFSVVVGLIYIERNARARSAFFERRTGRGQISMFPAKISSTWAGIVTLVCALPPIIGFGIPFYIHLKASMARPLMFLDEALWSSVSTSLWLATLGAILTLTLAIILVYAARLNPAQWFNRIIRLAASGYAVPGTMIGIGLLIPVLRFDNFIDGISERVFSYNLGLLIFSSGFPLIFAYAIRFMALAQGGIDAALTRISPNLDSASRTLGRGPLNTLLNVILPVIWPALLTAGLLVFIDAIKELSATMLLQPTGITTLSMKIFGHAEAGNLGRTGPPSLIMITLALVPTFFLAWSLERRVNSNLQKH